MFKTKNDSLTNIEKTTVINDLEQQYNKAKNEQTIKELHQQEEISGNLLSLYAQICSYGQRKSDCAYTIQR
jgi:hypothetical protein